MSKKSNVLDRDAEYVKTLKVSRLPGYMTVQMVRFQFKQKDAINAKILKDIKFPMMLDTFDLCTPELQEKLVPMRNKFKDYEDSIVTQSAKVKGTQIEFPTPGAKPPDAPGPPPPLRGRGRGIEAPRPPGAGDFLSETPGDAGAILLHKIGHFFRFYPPISKASTEMIQSSKS